MGFARTVTAMENRGGSRSLRPDGIPRLRSSLTLLERAQAGNAPRSNRRSVGICLDCSGGRAGGCRAGRATWLTRKTLCRRPFFSRHLRGSRFKASGRRRSASLSAAGHPQPDPGGVTSHKAAPPQRGGLRFTRAPDEGRSPLEEAIGHEALERYERALATLRPESRSGGRKDRARVNNQEIAEALGQAKRKRCAYGRGARDCAAGQRDAGAPNHDG